MVVFSYFFLDVVRWKIAKQADFLKQLSDFYLGDEVDLRTLSTTKEASLFMDFTSNLMEASGFSFLLFFVFNFDLEPFEKMLLRNRYPFLIRESLRQRESVECRRSALHACDVLISSDCRFTSLFVIFYYCYKQNTRLEW